MARRNVEANRCLISLRTISYYLLLGQPQAFSMQIPYPLGMMIQNSKYSSNPGTPPGSSEIRNAIRNHKGAIPKNSPKPPQTPAMMRLRRDRRKAPRALFIVSLLPNINPGLLVNQFHYNLRTVCRIVAIQTGKTCQEIFTATSIPSPAG